MAISKKPTNNKDLINKIIEKGGSGVAENIKSSQRIEKNKNTKITIRLPRKMLSLIDKYLNSSLEQTARSHWIKNAIIDKVNKDIIKERE